MTTETDERRETLRLTLDAVRGHMGDTTAKALEDHVAALEKERNAARGSAQRSADAWAAMKREREAMECELDTLRERAQALEADLADEKALRTDDNDLLADKQARAIAAESRLSAILQRAEDAAALEGAYRRASDKGARGAVLAVARYVVGEDGAGAQAADEARRELEADGVDVSAAMGRIMPKVRRYSLVEIDRAVAAALAEDGPGHLTVAEGVRRRLADEDAATPEVVDAARSAAGLPPLHCCGTTTDEHPETCPTRQALQPLLTPASPEPTTAGAEMVCGACDKAIEEHSPDGTAENCDEHRAEPTTAEAFATAYAGVMSDAATDAISLLERRMGAMGRAVQDYLDGKTSGFGLRAALAAAPPVFTPEEVERVVADYTAEGRGPPEVPVGLAHQSARNIYAGGQGDGAREVLRRLAALHK